MLRNHVSSNIGSSMPFVNGFVTLGTLVVIAAAYFSTLPIKSMVRHLRDAGIPASVSNTAGTFVCNHVFYALMHRLSRRAGPGVRGGFIHIPALPQQAARQPGMASMALETQIQGIRTAIHTAMTVQQDLQEHAGQLH